MLVGIASVDESSVKCPRSAATIIISFQLNQLITERDTCIQKQKQIDVYNVWPMGQQFKQINAH